MHDDAMESGPSTGAVLCGLFLAGCNALAGSPGLLLGLLIMGLGLGLILFWLVGK